MNWFQDGDRNTKFFHAQVNGRRKRLQLKRIQNSDGNWLEDNETMAEEAIKFYEAQFHEEQVPTILGIIEHVPTIVNYEQNQELIKQPTREEVKKVVYGLNGDSAGGQMALLVVFFIYVRI